MLIQWETNAEGNLLLKYRDASGLEESIAQVPAGSMAFIWTVPWTLLEEIVIIVQTEGESFTSPPISIGSAMEFVFPSGDAVLAAGGQVQVRWSTALQTTVDLALRQIDTGVENLIASQVNAAEERFSWSIPANEGSFLMLLKASGSETVLAQSAPFGIEDGELTIVSVNPEATTRIETPITISWQASNAGMVSLSYLRARGGQPRVIVENIPPEVNSWEWTAPFVPDEGYVLVLQSERLVGLKTQSAPIEVTGYMKVDLGDYPATKDVGQVVDVEVANRPRFAFRRVSTTEIKVISRVCTHNQCIVAWESQDNQFVCPCHGARYDADGGLETAIVLDQEPLPLLDSSYNATENTVEIFYGWEAL